VARAAANQAQALVQVKKAQALVQVKKAQALAVVTKAPHLVANQEQVLVKVNLKESKNGRKEKGRKL
jgi:hypothetical protein